MTPHSPLALINSALIKDIPPDDSSKLSRLPASESRLALQLRLAAAGTPTKMTEVPKIQPKSLVIERLHRLSPGRSLLHRNVCLDEVSCPRTQVHNGPGKAFRQFTGSRDVTGDGRPLSFPRCVA